MCSSPPPSPDLSGEFRTRVGVKIKIARSDRFVGFIGSSRRKVVGPLSVWFRYYLSKYSLGSKSLAARFTSRRAHPKWEGTLCYTRVIWWDLMGRREGGTGRERILEHCLIVFMNSLSFTPRRQGPGVGPVLSVGGRTSQLLVPARNPDVRSRLLGDDLLYFDVDLLGSVPLDDGCETGNFIRQRETEFNHCVDYKTFNSLKC